MKKTRFGLLGPGSIANTFASAIKQCENAELVAVASHNKKKAEDFAAKWSVDRFYGSYEELLNDKNIDAIYVAVINTKHLEVIEMCAKHKIPVICEKPLVMHQKDLLRIKEIQKENDTLIMEAMWTNFLPVTHKTKQWINEKRIGELKTIESAFCFKSDDFSSRLYQKKLGGGALYDVGVYTVAYSLFLIDSDVLSQTSDIEYAATGVDETGYTTLVFKNNARATCKYSISFKEPEDAKIVGTNGSIIVENFWRATKCTLLDSFGEVVEEFVDERDEGFYYEISHFASLVQEGAKMSPIMPLDRTLKCSKLFDVILTNKE